MKTSLKLFALGMILLGFSVGANAQVQTATAQSSAHIMTPITFAKTQNLSFGNIAAAATAGSVALAPSASATRTPTTVTLPATTGTVTAALFTITGEANFTFQISLPGSIQLKSGSNEMTLGNWKTSLGEDSQTTGTIDGEGHASFYVGGTLDVGANQAYGDYTNATGLTLTVNYN